MNIIGNNVQIIVRFAGEDCGDPPGREARNLGDGVVQNFSESNANSSDGEFSVDIAIALNI